jgi:hypothetical protein
MRSCADGVIPQNVEQPTRLTMTRKERSHPDRGGFANVLIPVVSGKPSVRRQSRAMQFGRERSPDRRLAEIEFATARPPRGPAYVQTPLIAGRPARDPQSRATCHDEHLQSPFFSPLSTQFGHIKAEFDSSPLKPATNLFNGSKTLRSHSVNLLMSRCAAKSLWVRDQGFRSDKCGGLAR